jgi:hypothetical protein
MAIIEVVNTHSSQVKFSTVRSISSLISSLKLLHLFSLPLKEMMMRLRKKIKKTTKKKKMMKKNQIKMMKL